MCVSLLFSGAGAPVVYGYAFALSGRALGRDAHYPGCRFACPGLRAFGLSARPPPKTVADMGCPRRFCIRAKRFWAFSPFADTTWTDARPNCRDQGKPAMPILGLSARLQARTVAMPGQIYAADRFHAAGGIAAVRLFRRNMPRTIRRNGGGRRAGAWRA